MTLTNVFSATTSQTASDRPDGGIISIDTLQLHFHQPLAKVAEELGVSLTMMKRLCRRLGIPRWPYRQICSINKTAEELREQLQAADNDVEREKFQRLLQATEKKKRLITRGAATGVEPAIRNALYLANIEGVDEDEIFENPELMPKLSAALKMVSKRKRVKGKPLVEVIANVRKDGTLPACVKMGDGPRRQSRQSQINGAGSATKVLPMAPGRVSCSRTELSKVATPQVCNNEKDGGFSGIKCGVQVAVACTSPRNEGDGLRMEWGHGEWNSRAMWGDSQLTSKSLLGLEDGGGHLLMPSSPSDSSSGGRTSIESLSSSRTSSPYCFPTEETPPHHFSFPQEGQSSSLVFSTVDEEVLTSSLKRECSPTSSSSSRGSSPKRMAQHHSLSSLEGSTDVEDCDSTGHEVGLVNLDGCDWGREVMDEDRGQQYLFQSGGELGCLQEFNQTTLNDPGGMSTPSAPSTTRGDQRQDMYDDTSISLVELQGLDLEWDEGVAVKAFPEINSHSGGHTPSLQQIPSRQHSSSFEESTRAYDLNRPNTLPIRLSDEVPPSHSSEFLEFFNQQRHEHAGLSTGVRGVGRSKTRMWRSAPINTPAPHRGEEFRDGKLSPCSGGRKMGDGCNRGKMLTRSSAPNLMHRTTPLQQHSGLDQIVDHSGLQSGGETFNLQCHTSSSCPPVIDFSGAVGHHGNEERSRKSFQAACSTSFSDNFSGSVRTPTSLHTPNQGALQVNTCSPSTVSSLLSPGGTADMVQESLGTSAGSSTQTWTMDFGFFEMPSAMAGLQQEGRGSSINSGGVFHGMDQHGDNFSPANQTTAPLVLWGTPDQGGGDSSCGSSGHSRCDSNSGLNGLQYYVEGIEQEYNADLDLMSEEMGSNGRRVGNRGQQQLLQKLRIYSDVVQSW